jgi:hypothetical protein
MAQWDKELNHITTLHYWQPRTDLTVSPSLQNIILKVAGQDRFCNNADQDNLQYKRDGTRKSEHGCRKRVHRRGCG